MTYDREHMKIGFWKTNCSEIWEKFHLPNSSAAEPSASIRENSTEEIMPTLTPSGPLGVNVGMISSVEFSLIEAEGSAAEELGRWNFSHISEQIS